MSTATVETVNGASTKKGERKDYYIGEDKKPIQRIFTDAEECKTASEEIYNRFKADGKGEKSKQNPWTVFEVDRLDAKGKAVDGKRVYVLARNVEDAIACVATEHNILMAARTFKAAPGGGFAITADNAGKRLSKVTEGMDDAAKKAFAANLLKELGIKIK